MSPQSLPSALITKKGQLHSKEPWIWLVEVPIDDTNAVRLALWRRDFTLYEQVGAAFVAHVFHGFNMSIPECALSVSGELNSATLTISDVRADILSYLQTSGSNIKGKDLRLILADSANPGSSGGAGFVGFTQTFQILRPRIREGQIQFELGHTNLTDIEIPGEDFQRAYCRFFYGDERCAFPKDTVSDGLSNVVDGFPLSVVAQDTCDHTLDGPNGCRAHAALAKIQGILYQPRFGGQPGLVKGSGV